MAGLSKKEINAFLQNDKLDLIWFRFHDGPKGGVGFSKTLKIAN